VLSTAGFGWFDLRCRRRSPDGDARRSNVIALAGRIPPKAKSSGYSGERLARPGFCSACDHLSSQSTICAEQMRRFGECGLIVPAVTPGRSARRALAKTFASSSFANSPTYASARLPDDVREVHRSLRSVCEAFILCGERPEYLARERIRRADIDGSLLAELAEAIRKESLPATHSVRSQSRWS
jgi:hypothetical protein